MLRGVGPFALGSLLILGGLTELRPALGSDEMVIASEDAPVLAADVPPLDAPGRRALVSRTDGTVRVWGPARPVPDRVGNPVVIDQAAAIRAVTDVGWPGATEASLVTTRHGTVAWRVDPPPSRTLLENPVFLVNATTGVVTLRHDRARTEQVGSFAINPIASPDAESFELLDYDPALSGGALQGDRVAVFNCVQPPPDVLGCDFATVDPSDGVDFLHPAPDISVPADNVQLEDAFAVQSVHHHAERFLDWLDDLGVPPTECVANGEPVVLVANYKAYLENGEPFLVGNAAYVGDCGLTASFGQGPQADYGYDGEVVYHELTHGVVETMLDGGVLSQARPRAEAVAHDAGAINEAVADLFASVYTDDPFHAEYTFEIGSGSGRRLDNDLRCPEAITGQVHADSEIMSGALWDAHQALGEPMLLALLDTLALMPEDGTFEELSNTLVEVVGEELGDDAAATVRAIVEARGLLDCPRITTPDALARDLWVWPRGQRGLYEPLQPPPLQLAIELPDDAVGFTLSFSTEVRPIPGFSPTTEIHALVRYGEPIEFSYEVDADGLTIVEAAPDEHLSAIDGDATLFGVDIEAPGGQTIYVALFNQSPNVTLISDVFAQPILGETPQGTGAGGGGSEGGGETGDEETGAADGDGGGCSCTTTDQAPLGWFVLVVLGLARRRSQRDAA